MFDAINVDAQPMNVDSVWLVMFRRMEKMLNALWRRHNSSLRRTRNDTQSPLNITCSGGYVHCGQDTKKDVEHWHRQQETILALRVCVLPESIYVCGNVYYCCHSEDKMTCHYVRCAMNMNMSYLRPSSGHAWQMHTIHNITSYRKA